jgi:hypothetical protein
MNDRGLNRVTSCIWGISNNALRRSHICGQYRDPTDDADNELAT